jgi:hypothetical protein
MVLDVVSAKNTLRDIRYLLMPQDIPEYAVYCVCGVPSYKFCPSLPGDDGFWVVGGEERNDLMNQSEIKQLWEFEEAMIFDGELVYGVKEGQVVESKYLLLRQNFLEVI